MKSCEVCGDGFVPRNSRSKYCSDECRLIRSRERNRENIRRYRTQPGYRDAELERQRTTRADRLANESGYREAVNDKYRQFYASNDDYRGKQIDRANERSRELRLAGDIEHAERQREANRRWRANPDNRIKQNEWSTARKRKIEKPNDETLEWISIVRRDPCSYCSDEGGHADHIIPVNHDGPNHWENLTGACQPCNSSKHDRLDLLVWMLQRKQRLEGRPSTVAV